MKASITVSGASGRRPVSAIKTWRASSGLRWAAQENAVSARSRSRVECSGIREPIVVDLCGTIP
jgi:hypothetical protein